MEVVGAIVAFLRALPELIKVYKSLKNIFGDNWDKFLKDVDEVSAIVEKSKAEGLTLEQKREMRKQALKKGSDIWSRIA